MERWKRFEEDTATYLSKQAATRPLLVHRFYDSRSAGTILPAQPADFLVIHQGIPILVELKSSEVHDSLRACFSSAVTKQQLAQHRIWRRAGARCWFLFYGAEGRYERWPHYACQEAANTGKPLTRGSQMTFSKLPDMLESILDTDLMI